MDFNITGRPVGEQLGIEGFDHFVERAAAVCECERQRIELVNGVALLHQNVGADSQPSNHAV